MRTSAANALPLDAEVPGPDRHLPFYGLVSPPFRSGPDPARLWLGNAHRVILDTLTRAIREDDGIALLTGDAGTGKTSLAQRLVAMLGPTGLSVGRVASPGPVPSDFFEAVLSAHGVRRPVHDSNTFRTCYRDVLSRAAAAGDKVLLVVDEAQGLSSELLSEVGRLSEMAAASGYPLVIMLVGETRLTALVQDERHAALRNRIIARCAVPPLGPEEVGAFVRHALDAAGAVTEVFTPDALRAIASLSRGAPGAINIIGDRALLGGRARRARPITEAIVMDCGRSPGPRPATVADLDRGTPRADTRRARPTGRGRLYLTIATSVLFVTGAPYLAWWLTGLGDRSPRTISDSAPRPPREAPASGDESPALAIVASPRGEAPPSAEPPGDGERVQLPERRLPSPAPIEAHAAIAVPPPAPRPRISVPRESPAIEERRMTGEIKPPRRAAPRPAPEAAAPRSRTPDGRPDGPDDPAAIIDWLVKESPRRR